MSYSETGLLEKQILSCAERWKFSDWSRERRGLHARVLVRGAGGLWFLQHTRVVKRRPAGVVRQSGLCVQGTLERTEAFGLKEESKGVGTDGQPRTCYLGWVREVAGQRKWAYSALRWEGSSTLAKGARGRPECSEP